MDTVLTKINSAVGKRKKAIARVVIVPGNGKLIINKVSGEKYLQYNTTYLNNIWSPLEKVKMNDKSDIIAIVTGGGLTGQADAIKLGVARNLCKIDNEYRTILKPYGLLTRDPRMKERKKYGLRKARKASQYSKR